MLEDTSYDFLEPLYLNEKMVLNCAAYLFKGYSLESETRQEDKVERTRSLKAGINFLEKVVSVEGSLGSKESQTSESKAARHYTLGGLHMSLIDELRARQMLNAIEPEQLIGDINMGRPYVEAVATLQPIAFYALLDTLRVTAPVLAEVIKSVVQQETMKSIEDALNKDVTDETEIKRSGRRQAAAEAVIKNIDTISDVTESALAQLAEDYKKSRNAEMVMWSVTSPQRAYGVVDLDIEDYEPEVLRGILAGGTVHIIGKPTRTVGEKDAINLLQKSVLFSALSLVDRAISDREDQSGDLGSFMQGLLAARGVTERFGLLQVAGPAVRLSAMSVCI